MDSLYKQVERDYNAWKLVHPDHVAVDDITEVTDITPESNPSPTESDEPLRKSVPAREKCGRPKGSSNEKAHKERDKYHQCLAAITEEYATELMSENHEHQQIPNNWLDNLIKVKKNEFSNEADCYIPKETIRSWVKRKNFNPHSTGVMSPLQEAKETLVFASRWAPFNGHQQFGRVSK